MKPMIYRDRSDAGRHLGERLKRFADRDDVVVLGLPRGGIPVAYEVAGALRATLDVFVVRKLGVPGLEEYAMGAIASGGARVLNEDAIRPLRIPPSVIDFVAEREEREIRRREAAYRGERPLVEVAGKTVIVVDDGLATGSTMLAAVAALRQMAPKRIIVAVPVGSGDACRSLERVADEVECLATPEPFQAVGLWYRTFDQTTDDEVRTILSRSLAQQHAGAGAQ